MNDVVCKICWKSNRFNFSHPAWRFYMLLLLSLSLSLRATSVKVCICMCPSRGTLPSHADNRLWSTRDSLDTPRGGHPCRAPWRLCALRRNLNWRSECVKRWEDPDKEGKRTPHFHFLVLDNTYRAGSPRSKRPLSTLLTYYNWQHLIARWRLNT